MDDINVILADHPGLGRVRLCECNSIHMSIGPVTLNLAPEAFAQTVTLLQNAMEQLIEIAGARQTESFGMDVSLSSRLTH